MYKQIFVPLDGSALAERILPHVQSIAKGTGANVVLFRVASSAPAAMAAEAPTEVRKLLEVEQARAAKYLEGVAKRLKDAGLATKIEVSVGEPAVEIVMAAEKEKADLIAIMSHGVTGLSHFDLGSVAEKIVK
ncbi:MAG TPA: universal stress protein, partial [Candidatus Methylomirabilis sp.]|nr:universal stress protein [Candidatus Methylomirabilis sp.]